MRDAADVSFRFGEVQMETFLAERIMRTLLLLKKKKILWTIKLLADTVFFQGFLLLVSIVFNILSMMLSNASLPV